MKVTRNSDFSSQTDALLLPFPLHVLIEKEDQGIHRPALTVHGFS